MKTRADSKRCGEKTSAASIWTSCTADSRRTLIFSATEMRPLGSHDRNPMSKHANRLEVRLILAVIYQQVEVRLVPGEGGKHKLVAHIPKRHETGIAAVIEPGDTNVNARPMRVVVVVDKDHGVPMTERNGHLNVVDRVLRSVPAIDAENAGAHRPRRDLHDVLLA